MLAMLASMSLAGCAGQVRLAGYAFIFSLVVGVVVVVVVVVFVVVDVVVGVLLLSLLLFLGAVRWFLDASIHVTFFTHNCNLGQGYGYFWSPNPVIWQAWSSTFAPWGTMGAIGKWWVRQWGVLPHPTPPRQGLNGQGLCYLPGRLPILHFLVGGP